MRKTAEKNNDQLYYQVIEAHKGLFYKIARIYCTGYEDQQDLIQEMMIQVWKGFASFRQESKTATWLYRVCLNVAISYVRKNKHSGKLFIDIAGHTNQAQPGMDNDLEENLQLLYTYIRELKEIDRAIILLYLDDKAHAEIADILGMTVTNVSTRVFRVKEWLKKKFGQQKI